MLVLGYCRVGAGGFFGLQTGKLHVVASVPASTHGTAQSASRMVVEFCSSKNMLACRCG